MRRFALFVVVLFCLTSCTADSEPVEVLPTPALPDALMTTDGEPPTLDVFIIDENALVPMDIETYVAGVVAGEIPANWPQAALEAQAILARTFVVKFIAEKESMYPGADISTDITEAQAFSQAAVNDAILEAVDATAGRVLVTATGALPYAWFHAHSGGSTGLAREGLGWKAAEPVYTRVTDGMDSPDAPESAKAWSASFTALEFLAACRKCGVHPPDVKEVSVLEKGDSGRTVLLSVSGKRINAADLRIALGSTKMRSTLLTSVKTDGSTVHMTGLGYGHGVGMPQWGAYALARDGLTGEEIACYYFDNLHIATLW